MKQVIILKGLPASGKSTYAFKLIDKNPGKYKRVNKDDLRAMLDNGKWSKSNEKLVLKIRDLIILESLESGFHVIVDDTNLHPKHETHIKQLVKGKAKVVVKDFTDVDINVCIERDLKRNRSVGERVIRRMYKQFIKTDKKLIQNKTLPPAIICDLDGTLALLNGRNPYDASTCIDDEVNIPIKDIITHFHKNGYSIIFVTGRDGKYYNHTLDFLHKKIGVANFHLFSRGVDDNRKDSIVKEEIFMNYIYNRYYVHFVLDDRNQVVEMWRDLGLTCLQVADGDF